MLVACKNADVTGSFTCTYMLWTLHIRMIAAMRSKGGCLPLWPSDRLASDTDLIVDLCAYVVWLYLSKLLRLSCFSMYDPDSGVCLIVPKVDIDGSDALCFSVHLLAHSDSSRPYICSFDVSNPFPDPSLCSLRRLHVHALGPVFPLRPTPVLPVRDGRVLRGQECVPCIRVFV